MLLAFVSSVANAQARIDGDIVLGSRTAPAEMIVYLSPQCPNCVRFQQETYPRLRPYVDAGRLRIVYREILIPAYRQQSLAELQIARCRTDDPNVYVERLTAIMNAQDDGPLWLPHLSDFPTRLIVFAQRFGLSPEESLACVQDPAGSARIDAFTTDATARYGLRGVPSVVIDGELTLGDDYDAIASRLGLEEQR